MRPIDHDERAVAPDAHLVGTRLGEHSNEQAEGDAVGSGRRVRITCSPATSSSD